MDKTTTQITMLGTGNATVSQIYNTCFVLQTPSTLMLVDAGGGNGILAQLKKIHVQISDIHHLFVTHAHTDHEYKSDKNRNKGNKSKKSNRHRQPLSGRYGHCRCPDGGYAVRPSWGSYLQGVADEAAHFWCSFWQRRYTPERFARSGKSAELRGAFSRITPTVSMAALRLNPFLFTARAM